MITWVAYEQVLPASVEDPERFWLDAAKAIDWHTAPDRGARRLPPAVLPLVPRRQAQRLPQRAGPPRRRRARRPARPDPRLPGHRVAAHIHLPRAARRGGPVRRRAGRARRRPRRPRGDLPADGARGRGRDAGELGSRRCRRRNLVSWKRGCPIRLRRPGGAPLHCRRGRYDQVSARSSALRCIHLDHRIQARNLVSRTLATGPCRAITSATRLARANQVGGTVDQPLRETRGHTGSDKDGEMSRTSWATREKRWRHSRRDRLGTRTANRHRGAAAPLDSIHPSSGASSHDHI